MFFRWIATGLDNLVPNGRGPHTVEPLTAAVTDKPLSAGTVAVGGSLLGALSVSLAGVFSKLGVRRSSEPKVAVNA